MLLLNSLTLRIFRIHPIYRLNTIGAQVIDFHYFEEMIVANCSGEIAFAVCLAYTYSTQWRIYTTFQKSKYCSEFSTIFVIHARQLLAHRLL